MSTEEEAKAFQLGIRAAEFGASAVPDLKDNELCSVAGCSNLATDHWSPSVCALREAGISVDWVAICAKHDVQLNVHTTRFFFGNKYDAALAMYANNRLA